MGSATIGLADLFLPGTTTSNATGTVSVCAAAVGAGLWTRMAPWDRWPRQATLMIVPVAFALIGLGNFFGPIDRSYTFGIYFVVAFAWIGMSHPQFSSLKAAPLAAVAYVLPFYLHPQGRIEGASTVVVVLTVCLMIGESLAWITKRAFENHHHARTLARIATELGAHLSQSGIFESLVGEAALALSASHAALYRLDPATESVSGIYIAGSSSRTVPMELDLSQEWTARLRLGDPIAVSSSGEASLISAESLGDLGVEGYVVIPVLGEGTLIGLFFCARTKDGRRFGKADLALGHDIAEMAGVAMLNALLYEQTLQAALCDSLTGLGNRRAFQERLELEVDKAVRHARQLSLIMVDLDDLKSVNDSWGHQTGDRVLCRMGEYLSATVRKQDGAFRIGGDEFALLLPDASPATALQVAERLRRSIQRATLGGGQEIRLTASIGIGSFPHDATSPDPLFARADAAMYKVKVAGGDAISLATEGRNGHAKKPFGLDLLEVLKDQSLHAVFQPICSLADGGVIAYEAFCRLDESVGDLPITTAFRAAGSLGLLTKLDRTCRAVTLRDFSALGAPEVLFLNISPAAVEAPDFAVTEILGAIAGVGIDPSRVVIELTEQERSPSSSLLADNLAICREAGLKVALDDLGAGGADLELLARLPFDYVKIDLSLIRGQSWNRERRRLLRGLSHLVFELGAQCIAEAVEGRECFDLVSELGFHGVQGFYIGEPSRTLAAPRFPHRLEAVLT